MKYALIGCGRIAGNHLQAALTNNLEIVGLCDVVIEKAEEKLAQFELLEDKVCIYTNYRVMLEERTPEVVSICTESGNHAKIALDCIRLGIHVIIEKPIALSIADANAIVKAASEHHVKVSACHQNRFNKSIVKIREAVEANRFGKLFYGTAHVRWNRNRGYYQQAPWRGTWEQDGGALMNQCIHNIDLLRWMMGGHIEQVFAYTDNLNHPYIEGEDVGLALVKFTNGSYGMIEGTTNVYPKNLEETLYLFGEHGTVKVGGQSVNKIEEWNFADGLDNSKEIIAMYQENPTNVYGFGHTPLFTDMIAAIREDRDPLITAEDGKNAVELILAIYKSAASGKPVQLPLAEGSTLDFKGRFV